MDHRSRSAYTNRNQELWDQQATNYQKMHGGQLAASGGAAWGVWQIPESELRVLGDVRGRDVLELYGATKRPHPNRDLLAKLLGRSPAAVHLYEGHIGGGFGVRGEIYPEDVLVCLAALRLARPVKWIEDRREHLMSACHSRDQHHDAEIAFDDEGRILAFHDSFVIDCGARPVLGSEARPGRHALAPNSHCEK